MTEPGHNILPRSFYSSEPHIVAPTLLGKYLVRRLNNDVLIGKIVEVEAYLAYVDTAAHSFRGKTKRTEVLFGEAGFTYIYSIHTHYCMDIVTSQNGTPGSVLIRALEPVKGTSEMEKLRGINILQKLTNGPGKLCQALGINRDQNGADVTNPTSPIIITQGENIAKQDIITSKRVGVTSSKDLELRFFIKNNPFVSR